MGPIKHDDQKYPRLLWWCFEGSIWICLNRSECTSSESISEEWMSRVARRQRVSSRNGRSPVAIIPTQSHPRNIGSVPHGNNGRTHISYAMFSIQMGTLFHLALLSIMLSHISCIHTALKYISKILIFSGWSCSRHSYIWGVWWRM